MKVPNDIKKAIKECAEAESKANFYERIIIKWLEDMKLTEDTCTDIEKDMTDAFIDYCKMSYAPDEFIEVLENLGGENDG